MAKYFYQYFQIFFIFIDQNLLTRWWRKRKNTHTVINEKRKTEKSWTLFYNRLFHKALSKDNHCFYLSSSFAAQFLLFDIRDIKRGGWKRHITRDGKLNIYFKNNFSLLVINVTQLNFLNWHNVHIWHFVKVHHKRRLLFVAAPTLISWSKKFFTDYNDKI